MRSERIGPNDPIKEKRERLAFGKVGKKKQCLGGKEPEKEK